MNKYPFYDTITKIVEKYSPSKIIEFGTGHGYTSEALAKGLRNGSMVFSYDISDELLKNKKNIIYGKMDIFEWMKNPQNFDMMYIDVNNDGEKIKFFYEKLKDKIQQGKIVLFEGGIPERDGKHPLANWMLRCVPIYPLKDIVNYEIVDNRFPGLSMFKK